VAWDGLVGLLALGLLLAGALNIAHKPSQM
jgi:hypothetical protein